MKVVDFINALSQHPGDAEVTSVEWDDAGVYVEIAKPPKPRRKKDDGP